MADDIVVLNFQSEYALARTEMTINKHLINLAKYRREKSVCNEPFHYILFPRSMQFSEDLALAFSDELANIDHFYAIPLPFGVESLMPKWSHHLNQRFDNVINLKSNAFAMQQTNHCVLLL